MDLVNELLIKAIEVGAATYATQYVSGGASSAKNTDGTPKSSMDISALPTALQSVLETIQENTSKLPEVLDSSDPVQRRWVKLGMCIVIDLIGSGQLPIPFLADALDVIWAPVSALCLHALFANPLVTAGGFAEEILPGTDGIPTASLAWIYENYGTQINALLKELNGATDVAAQPVKEKSNNKKETKKRAPFFRKNKVKSKR